MDKRYMSSDEILNECLEAIIRGESEESCLMRYPQQAAELRPLLKTMVAARQACRVSPRPEFRARARYEYNRAVADACNPQPKKGFRWSWRLSTAIPVAVAVMMMSGGGVLAASASSIPGQPLYAVKLAVEQMQLNLTSSEDGKTKVYAALASRRVDEIIVLTDGGNPNLAGEATLRLEDTLNKITSNLKITYPQRDQTIVKAPAPIPPGEFITAILNGEKSAIDSYAGPVANVNPALLNLLKNYATQDKAKLEAVLNRLPENDRLQLQHAIDSYQAILDAQSAAAN